jgi:hypothetical protein
MATLNPSNIVNGNIIEPSDILQLYQAFGTGSGANITGLSMTGSLNGNASTATTSSFAVTSSYALNASVSQVDSQRYDDGSTILTGNFKFIGGKVTMTSGAATSNTFSVLLGKILGVNAFITANYISGNGPTDSVIVSSINGSGAVVFSNNTSGAPASAVIVFTGFYI